LAIAVMTPATSTLLSARNISKSFGGARAIDDVSFDIRAGEVHALLGENGAGKSTLVKVIARSIRPDEGTIHGSAWDSPQGITMVFQELSVLPKLSVRENLALVIDVGKCRLLKSRKTVDARARQALRSAGLDEINLNMPTEALSLSQRQLLEIARGIASDSRILILDEPTATLSDVEIARIHAVIRETVKQGRAVIYITHRLGEVFALSSYITVMRTGKVVARRTRTT
jgi:ribose transport system ATP-binding protein